MDATGRPAVGVEVLLSGLGRGRGNGRCFRGRGPIARAIPDRRSRPKRIPRRARFLMALWAYDPKAGLAGQAISPSALPAAGSVQLKLGGPVHTAVRVVGPDGKPVAGARVAPAAVRVAGGSGPRRRSRRPTRSPTCSRRRPTPHGKGTMQGCRAEDIEAVRLKPPGSVSSEAQLGAGADSARRDHAQGRRPADRPRSDRRPVRGAGFGGHRHDTATDFRRPTNVGRGPRDDRCQRPL